MELSLCCLICLKSYFSAENEELTTKSDYFSKTMTYVFFIILLILPIYMAFKILQNKKDLESP